MYILYTAVNEKNHSISNTIIHHIFSVELIAIMVQSRETVTKDYIQWKNRWIDNENKKGNKTKVPVFVFEYIVCRE